MIEISKRTDVEPLVVRWPFVVAIVAVLLAIPPIWPYGYYVLLRLIVCGAAVYGAVQANSQQRKGWVWVLAGVAFLFNPLIPVHAAKEAWALVDLGTAALLGRSAFVLRHRCLEPQSRSQRSEHIKTRLSHAGHLWFRKRKPRAPAIDPALLSSEEPINATPQLLAHVFLAMVASHMDALLSWDRGGVLELLKLPFTRRKFLYHLTEDQKTNAFKQLCLFYDALWWHMLPERILETGSVPPESITQYMKVFRSEAMSVIAGAGYLPRPWRFWSEGPLDHTLPVDFDFYMTENIPAEYSSDYEKVMNICKVPRERTTVELCARLQTRLCQILGFFDNPDPLKLFILWQTNCIWPHEFVMVFDRMHPVPAALNTP